MHLRDNSRNGQIDAKIFEDSMRDLLDLFSKQDR